MIRRFWKDIEPFQTGWQGAAFFTLNKMRPKIDVNQTTTQEMATKNVDSRPLNWSVGFLWKNDMDTCPIENL